VLTTITKSTAGPAFLNPQEAIEQLNVITSRLLVAGESRSHEFIASEVYILALMAQAKILNYLNDENFFCRVLWDPRTNLPSHPSLAADAGKYGETFNSFPELKSILNSLSGWALLRQEKISCCCGRKERIVELDIMLNTIMKVEGGGLSVKLLAGVKTDDNDHLEEHYNLKSQSRVEGDLYIIFTCENLISLDGGEVVIEPVSFSHAERFYVPELEKQIRGLVSQLAVA